MFNRIFKNLTTIYIVSYVAQTLTRTPIRHKHGYEDT